MEVPTTTIKMTYGGETKPALLASPEEDHWNSLEKQFREQFSISTEDIKAKYVDEEGDRVSIDSNEELRHLLAQGKPLQLEFSLEGQNMKKREGGRRISCEDRLRLRQERMMKKFGKVLTKEELIQLREERKKERMMKKEEKVAKLEERKKFQQQRRIDRMIKKFGKILSEEELTQKREEMRNKRTSYCCSRSSARSSPKKKGPSNESKGEPLASARDLPKKSPPSEMRILLQHRRRKKETKKGQPVGLVSLVKKRGS